MFKEVMPVDLEMSGSRYKGVSPEVWGAGCWLEQCKRGRAAAQSLRSKPEPD